MKKLTIKLKITLWFTVVMILLCVVVFAFIAVVSNSASSQNTRNALTDLVDKNTREIEYDDGELEIDDGFTSYHNGIFCLVFSENGKKVSGSAPHNALEEEPFDDARIRRVSADGDTYFLYDRRIDSKRYEDIWVRGVVLERGGAMGISEVSGAALIALPLLIIMAAVGGYLIAGRLLRPIQKISRTAEEIGGSGDLSKRIEIDSRGDELHQLAGTFNRMFERLETNFDAERNFTSDASHELRTPIATILAQCEYAFENASGESELYEAIGSIQRQGHRMSHLVDTLLYFTRMEQGTEAVLFEMVDVSELVLSVCREHKEIGDKNIALTETVQPNIGMNADVQLVARMLANLIENAYRYGKESGSIHVELKEEVGMITLSVADDGIGIAPDELPKIWNRFYRVDKSRSFAAGKGLGLGLAMVRQIAEMHGGTVYVMSETEKGSTFSIQFAKK